MKFAPVSRILCVFSRRDGHFSIPVVADEVTTTVAHCRSNQPERSAGRVSAFCLVLHRTEVIFARFVAKTRVRSYRTFAPLPFECGMRRAECGMKERKRPIMHRLLATTTSYSAFLIPHSKSGLFL